MENLTSKYWQMPLYKHANRSGSEPGHSLRVMMQQHQG